MKLLIFLLLLSSSCLAQKFVLIDKVMKSPLLYTDSVSLEQTSRGFFPIRVNDMDSVLNAMKKIKGILSVLAKNKFDGFRDQIGATTFKAAIFRMANGDRWEVTISTDTGPFTTSWILSNPQTSNKHSAKYLSRLITYIQKDRSLNNHKP